MWFTKSCDFTKKVGFNQPKWRFTLWSSNLASWDPIPSPYGGSFCWEKPSNYRDFPACAASNQWVIARQVFTGNRGREAPSAFCRAVHVTGGKQRKRGRNSMMFSLYKLYKLESGFWRCPAILQCFHPILGFWLKSYLESWHQPLRHPWVGQCFGEFSRP